MGGKVIMKFKDCNFQGKKRYQKSIRRNIYDKLDHDIWSISVFSFLAIERYLDVLIEETDFNPKTKVFYEGISKTKISIDLFAKIASEYILEHIDDFAVEKLKGRRE